MYIHGVGTANDLSEFSLRWSCIRTGEAVAVLFFKGKEREGMFALAPMKDLSMICLSVIMFLV